MIYFHNPQLALNGNTIPVVEEQGAYNSGKPGKLGDFLILENSGKFEMYSGNF